MARKRIKIHAAAEPQSTAAPVIEQLVGLETFPSGSTMLNLALSDNPYGGYCKGSIVNIVGDSSAGKTFLLWTLFAEIAHNEWFNDYRLIFDEPEAALHFNLEELFGETTAERVERIEKSFTVEDFYRSVEKMIKEGRPFIYGLDSFDALTSEAEQRRDIGDGSYRMEKAKVSSEILRRIMGRIEQTQSLVVVVSQTRDKIGVVFGDKKTRSGGRALRFYSTHELWLAVKGHIPRTVRGKKREIGVNIVAKLKKNKLTGRLHTVEFPILWDYGVDDTTSMVNWLVDEGAWKKVKGRIKSWHPNLTTDTLVEYLEEHKLLPETIREVDNNWHEIQEALRTERRKYDG